MQIKRWLHEEISNKKIKKERSRNNDTYCRIGKKMDRKRELQGSEERN
jgi:hypothetical protein